MAPTWLSKDAAGHVLLDGTVAKLTQQAADALNTTFGVSLFKKDIPVGTVHLTAACWVSLATVPSSSTCPAASLETATLVPSRNSSGTWAPPAVAVSRDLPGSTMKLVTVTSLPPAENVKPPEWSTSP